MKLKKHILLILAFLFVISSADAAFLLIPMDQKQKEHLKAYGIAFWSLQNGVEVKWLLNYRGGSFMVNYYDFIES